MKPQITWIKASKSKKPLEYNIQKLHPTLNLKMRRILLEWLVDVQLYFQCSDRALFLCFELLDRLIESCKKMCKRDFQCYGIVCLWISSKYEDSTHKNLEKICDVCEDCYDQKKILETEKEILNTLNWELYGPTVYSFANEYLERIDFEKEIISPSSSSSISHQSNQASIEHLFSDIVPEAVNYLVHISYYYSIYFKNYSKMQIAAASVYLSLLSFDLVKTFPPSILKMIDSSLSPLLECCNLLSELFKSYLSSFPSHDSPAIHSKFCMEKYKRVAEYLLPVNLIPN